MQMFLALVFAVILYVVKGQTSLRRELSAVPTFRYVKATYTDDACTVPAGLYQTTGIGMCVEILTGAGVATVPATSFRETGAVLNGILTITKTTYSASATCTGDNAVTTSTITLNACAETAVGSGIYTKYTGSATLTFTPPEKSFVVKSYQTNDLCGVGVGAHYTEITAYAADTCIKTGADASVKVTTIPDTSGSIQYYADDDCTTTSGTATVNTYAGTCTANDDVGDDFANSRSFQFFSLTPASVPATLYSMTTYTDAACDDADAAGFYQTTGVGMCVKVLNGAGVATGTSYIETADVDAGVSITVTKTTYTDVACTTGAAVTTSTITLGTCVQIATGLYRKYTSGALIPPPNTFVVNSYQATDLCTAETDYTDITAYVANTCIMTGATTSVKVATSASGGSIQYYTGTTCETVDGAATVKTYFDECVEKSATAMGTDLANTKAFQTSTYTPTDIPTVQYAKTTYTDAACSTPAGLYQGIGIGMCVKVLPVATTSFIEFGVVTGNTLTVTKRTFATADCTGTGTAVVTPSTITLNSCAPTGAAGLYQKYTTGAFTPPENTFVVNSYQTTDLCTAAVSYTDITAYVANTCITTNDGATLKYIKVTTSTTGGSIQYYEDDDCEDVDGSATVKTYFDECADNAAGADADFADSKSYQTSVYTVPTVPTTRYVKATYTNSGCTIPTGLYQTTGIGMCVKVLTGLGVETGTSFFEFSVVTSTTITVTKITYTDNACTTGRAVGTTSTINLNPTCALTAVGSGIYAQYTSGTFTPPEKSFIVNSYQTSDLCAAAVEYTDITAYAKDTCIKTAAATSVKVIAESTTGFRIQSYTAQPDCTGSSTASVKTYSTCAANAGVGADLANTKSFQTSDQITASVPTVQYALAKYTDDDCTTPSGEYKATGIGMCVKVLDSVTGDPTGTSFIQNAVVVAGVSITVTKTTYTDVACTTGAVVGTADTPISLTACTQTATSPASGVYQKYTSGTFTPPANTFVVNSYQATDLCTAATDYTDITAYVANTCITTGDGTTSVKVTTTSGTGGSIQKYSDAACETPVVGGPTVKAYSTCAGTTAAEMGADEENSRSYQTSVYTVPTVPTTLYSMTTYTDAACTATDAAGEYKTTGIGMCVQVLGSNGLATGTSFIEFGVAGDDEITVTKITYTDNACTTGGVAGTPSTITLGGCEPIATGLYRQYTSGAFSLPENTFVVKSYQTTGLCTAALPSTHTDITAYSANICIKTGATTSVKVTTSPSGGSIQYYTTNTCEFEDGAPTVKTYYTCAPNSGMGTDLANTKAFQTFTLTAPTAPMTQYVKANYLNAACTTPSGEYKATGFGMCAKVLPGGTTSFIEFGVVTGNTLTVTKRTYASIDCTGAGTTAGTSSTITLNSCIQIATGLYTKYISGAFTAPENTFVTKSYQTTDSCTAAEYTDITAYAKDTCIMTGATTSVKVIANPTTGPVTGFKIRSYTGVADCSNTPSDVIKTYLPACGANAGVGADLVDLKSFQTFTLTAVTVRTPYSMTTYTDAACNPADAAGNYQTTVYGLCVKVLNGAGVATGTSYIETAVDDGTTITVTKTTYADIACTAGGAVGTTSTITLNTCVQIATGVYAKYTIGAFIAPPNTFVVKSYQTTDLCTAGVEYTGASAYVANTCIKTGAATSMKVTTFAAGGSMQYYSDASCATTSGTATVKTYAGTCAANAYVGYDLASTKSFQTFTYTISTVPTVQYAKTTYTDAACSTPAGLYQGIGIGMCAKVLPGAATSFIEFGVVTGNTLTVTKRTYTDDLCTAGGAVGTTSTITLNSCIQIATGVYAKYTSGAFTAPQNTFVVNSYQMTGLCAAAVSYTDITAYAKDTCIRTAASASVKVIAESTTGFRIQSYATAGCSDSLTYTVKTYTPAASPCDANAGVGADLVDSKSFQTFALTAATVRTPYSMTTYLDADCFNPAGNYQTTVVGMCVKVLNGAGVATGTSYIENAVVVTDVSITITKTTYTDELCTTGAVVATTPSSVIPIDDNTCQKQDGSGLYVKFTGDEFTAPSNTFVVLSYQTTALCSAADVNTYTAASAFAANTCIKQGDTSMKVTTSASGGSMQYYSDAYCTTPSDAASAVTYSPTCVASAKGDADFADTYAFQTFLYSPTDIPTVQYAKTTYTDAACSTPAGLYQGIGIGMCAKVLPGAATSFIEFGVVTGNTLTVTKRTFTNALCTAGGAVGITSTITLNSCQEVGGVYVKYTSGAFTAPGGTVSVNSYQTAPLCGLAVSYTDITAYAKDTCIKTSATTSVKVTTTGTGGSIQKYSARADCTSTSTTTTKLYACTTNAGVGADLVDSKSVQSFSYITPTVPTTRYAMTTYINSGCTIFAGYEEVTGTGMCVQVLGANGVQTGVSYIDNTVVTSTTITVTKTTYTDIACTTGAAVVSTKVLDAAPLACTETATSSGVWRKYTILDSAFYAPAGSVVFKYHQNHHMCTNAPQAAYTFAEVFTADTCIKTGAATSMKLTTSAAGGSIQLYTTDALVTCRTSTDTDPGTATAGTATVVTYSACTVHDGGVNHAISRRTMAYSASVAPTPVPTQSHSPTGQPSGAPSRQPTMQPTTRPSRTADKGKSRPTPLPTAGPTNPTGSPTGSPTGTPTSMPTQPTGSPTGMPTSAPSYTKEAWGQVVTDKKRHRMGGLCDNHCSNHGTCEMNSNCKCFTGLSGEPEWTGPDCSMRTCPKDFAWAGSVIQANNIHSWEECSNKGICDRKTGSCACFPGYDGVACQRTVCPQNCNDRGTCWPEKHLAAKVGRTYSAPWDAMKHVGCFCDPGYRGPACELQECPSGTDPLDGYGNEAGRDCSGRGLCNFQDGTCGCFSGFYGTQCQYQTTIF